MSYLTARQLRSEYKLDLRDDIPDDDKFMLGTGNPHPDNKVATLDEWVKLPNRNQGINWVFKPCSSSKTK